MDLVLKSYRIGIISSDIINVLFYRHPNCNLASQAISNEFGIHVQYLGYNGEYSIYGFECSKEDLIMIKLRSDVKFKIYQS